jgi:hypothetical protein
MSETSTTLLLIVVQVVTALLQIVLTPLFQVWLEQRAASKTKPPETELALDALPHEVWFMRLINSPWILPPSFVALDVWWLVYNSRSRAPITRLDIYNIASMAAAIWFNIYWVSLNMMRRQMRQRDAVVLSGFRNISEVISAGVNRLKESVQGLSVPKDELEKLEKLRGELEKTRGALEKLPPGRPAPQSRSV